jgi:hypothetical protein
MKHYIALRTYYSCEQQEHIYSKKEINIDKYSKTDIDKYSETDINKYPKIDIDKYPQFASKAILKGIKLGSYLYNVTIPEGQEYYEISFGVFVCSHIIISNPQLITLEVVEQLISEGADPSIDNYTPLINSVRFNDFDLFTYYHNIHGLPLDANDNACLKLALEKHKTHEKFISYILNYTEATTKPKTNIGTDEYDSIINETIHLIKIAEDRIRQLKPNEPLIPIPVDEYIESNVTEPVTDRVFYPVRSVSPTIETNYLHELQHSDDNLSDIIFSDFDSINFDSINFVRTQSVDPEQQLTINKPAINPDNNNLIKSGKNKKRFGVFLRKNKKVGIQNFDETEVMLQ